MAEAKTEIVIWAARPDEGPSLREIAIATKSHWGYERMGAGYNRDTAPSASGRINPVMRLDLGN